MKSKKPTVKKPVRPCKVTITGKKCGGVRIIAGEGRVELIFRLRPDLEDRQELLRD
jgi:hypothetical protein